MHARAPVRHPRHLPRVRPVTQPRPARPAGPALGLVNKTLRPLAVRLEEPSMDWVFHTHGWAYNFISPGQARNHHAPPRPAARTLPASKGPALASHWPGPPLSQARTRPAHRTGPHPLPTARPARHAHLHDAQPRFHSTHRIRRRNTAPPQVASDASTLHGAQGPKSPWPGSGPHR